MAKCRVFLLDESEIEIGFDVHADGKQLLESVCKSLDLVEEDYFGLAVKDDSSGNKIWVRTDKTIKKQFPIYPASWKFIFGVKYYPTDPSYLKEEITKYQLCLQVRDDLMCGRLPCPLDTLAILSSYWLQSEFGDGEEESLEVKRYLASFKYITGKERPAEGFEDKLRKLYKSRRGMPPCDADTQFLRLASNLPQYGLHRYETQDKEGNEKFLAVGSSGVFEISDKGETFKYKWGTIKNINYKKEKFYVKLLPKTPDGHAEKHTYKLASPRLSKALWRDAVDQHVFFRVTESDKTSSSPTTGSAPQVEKGDYFSKKRKRSFRFSFRKKPHNNEAQVRAKSARIGRPNRTVERHPILRRLASTNSSQKSVKSDSSENSSLSKESKKEEDEEKIKTSTQIRSILKRNQEPEKEKRVEQHEQQSEDEEEEEEGRPFTNEDFFDESTDPKDVSHSAGSLLLTETIPEEDEEVEEHKKSIAIEAYVKTSQDTTDSLLAPEIKIEFEPGRTNNRSEEECSESKIPCPEITVEIYHEPSDANNLYELKEVKKTELMPPPLRRESTKEALKTYFEDDKSNVATTSNPKVDLKTIKLDETKMKAYVEMPLADTTICPEANSTCDNTSATTRAESPSSIPGPDFITSNGKLEDEDEDDRRTVGASSAVAILGDDDVTIRDLADDVTIGDLTEYSRGRSDVAEDDSHENGSNITPSPESSISDLTDNTEELCNPNILEIIWSKSSESKEYGYREIFGVKLRSVRGRARHVKSAAFDLDEHVSVATQIPTPPLSDASHNINCTKNTKKSGTSLFERKFIPSWPFDPDSLAQNVELDELDKEAINAALQAQRSLMEDEKSAAPPLKLSGISTNSENTNVDFLHWEEEDAQTKDTYKDGTPRSIAESIPGIPLFIKSVVKSETNSFNESRRTSLSSNCSGQTQTKIISEELVYPPTIQTYENKNKKSPRFLIYKPDVAVVEHSPEDAEVATEDQLQTESCFLVEDATQTSNAVVKPEDLIKVEEEAKNDDSVEYTNQVDDLGSGRSTPSSVSSFPRFVHSIYPLRKPSTTGLTTSQERRSILTQNTNRKKEGDSDDEESITSSSGCSVKSVRGSIAEANDGVLEEEMLGPQNKSTGSRSTQITIIDFVNENCSPEDVQRESLQVNVEIVRLNDGRLNEVQRVENEADRSSMPEEIDYVDDFEESSGESSLDTSETSSSKAGASRPSMDLENFQIVYSSSESSSTSPEAWSTVTNVTTSDEGMQSPECSNQTFLPVVNNDDVAINLSSISPRSQDSSAFDTGRDTITDPQTNFLPGDLAEVFPFNISTEKNTNGTTTLQSSSSNNESEETYTQSKTIEVHHHRSEPRDSNTSQDTSAVDDDTPSETTEEEFFLDELPSSEVARGPPTEHTDGDNI